MSKNKSFNHELLGLILTGSISLSKFIELSKSCDLCALHPTTGESILHYVAHSNKFEFALDAMEYCYEELGVDLNTPSKNGETFLFKAFQASNYDLAEFLIGEGADVNSVNSKNETAIFHVLESFDTEMLDLFLKFGCDVGIRDLSGKTVLDYAEETDVDDMNDEIISLLNQYLVENSTDKKIEVYKLSKVQKAHKEGLERESLVVPMLSNMLDKGEYRKLKSIDEQVFKGVGDLKVRFPHFGEVIDYIKEQICLSLLAEEPCFSLKPLLLYGGPGVGKTRFNKELSNVVGTDIVIIDGGTVTGGFILGGGSSMWKDSGPGRVAKQIVKGDYANPICILDEIDKMSAQQGHDPFGPLHPLLEYNTAKDFIDEYISVPIDCSYINWIATANELSTIPDSILSRFMVVKIPDPSLEQMIQITHSVYRDIIEDPINPWGSRFEKELDKDIVNRLCSMTPRQINRTLLSALGKAALRNKGAGKDSLIKVIMQDVETNKIGEKNKMGLI